MVCLVLYSGVTVHSEQVHEPGMTLFHILAISDVTSRRSMAQRVAGDVCRGIR